MSHDLTPEEKSLDGKREFQEANARRVEDLLHISNRYVRTQRHLEQHSGITSLDNLKHSFKVQEEREGRIENLKNIIAYGKHDEVDEKRNIKRHLEYTDHYLQHHAPHMEQATLQHTMAKQEHRKEQLKYLD